MVPTCAHDCVLLCSKNQSPCRYAICSQSVLLFLLLCRCWLSWLWAEHHPGGSLAGPVAHNTHQQTHTGMAGPQADTAAAAAAKL